MAIKTTCIGAYPKPDYVPVTDWFQVGHDVEDYNDKVLRVWQNAQTPEARDLMDKATAEAVADQISCGVEVPTDGEIRRENYVHYRRAAYPRTIRLKGARIHGYQNDVHRSLSKTGLRSCHRLVSGRT